VIFTVDLHTHILPGVDDGAENFKEAIEMLKIAHSNGTTGIVLTPHYLTRDMRSHRLKKQELIQRFEIFRDAVATEIPDIKLYMGAEMFGVSNIEDVIEYDMIIPINGTRYVLTEFGFSDYLQRALEVTNKLITAGYTPIIAHPERYSFIQRNPRDIVQFLEKGAVLQINSSSLAGHNGALTQDVALSFIENDLAAIVASDAHSTYQRVPDLSEVYSFISSNFSPAYAEDLMYNNPLNIVKGKML
jgi:protein-tyrosine phosphatase